MAFTGFTVEIPIDGGWYMTPSVLAAPPGFLVDPENISFFGGGISKMKGLAKYSTSVIDGGATIIAGIVWAPSSSVSKHIVLTGTGKLIKDDGAGAFNVTLKSGMTPGLTGVFVPGGKESAGDSTKLFVFTPSNPVQVLTADSATTHDLTSPPTDWTGVNQPTCGASHAGRMWGAGNPNDPHRVYYSASNNHENFSSGNSGNISVFPGEGFEITGLVSFNKLLIVFKKAGIYYVDTSNPTSTNWTVQRATKASGLSNPQAVVQTPDDIIFLDRSGVPRSIRATDLYGDIATFPVFQEFGSHGFFHSSTGVEENPLILRALYFDAHFLTIFYVPVEGGTVNQIGITHDREYNKMSRITRDVVTSLWDDEDQMFEGDNAGNVWRFLHDPTDDTTKNGSSFSCRFRTAPTDFSSQDPSLAGRRKIGRFLRVLGNQGADQQVTASIYWDGILRDTKTLSFGLGGAVLGSTFVLGSAILGGSLGGRIAETRIRGSGDILQIEFSHNQLAGGFRIFKVWAGLSAGSRRASK